MLVCANAPHGLRANKCSWLAGQPTRSPSSCCGWPISKSSGYMSNGRWQNHKSNEMESLCLQLSGSIMWPVCCCCCCKRERAQVGDRLPTLWQLSFGPLARWPVGLAFCSQLESEGGFGHYLVRLRFVFPGQWVNYCFMICFGAASAAANILCVMCLLPAYKHYCSYAPRPVAYASCCAKR